MKEHHDQSISSDKSLKGRIVVEIYVYLCFQLVMQEKSYFEVYLATNSNPLFQIRSSEQGIVMPR
jgi:hypothetical protein